MKKIKFVCMILTTILLFSFVLSSCAVEYDTPEAFTHETIEAQALGEELEEIEVSNVLDTFDRVDRKYQPIVHCYSEEEYLDFLESDQCPPQFYVSLDAFKELGTLTKVTLRRYDNVFDRLEARFFFETDTIHAMAVVRYNFPVTDWWTDSSYTEITNMPADGYVELPTQIQALNGNYYPFSENVRFGFSGDFLYCSRQIPVLHINVDNVQVWISPTGVRVVTGQSVWRLYRKDSPMIDRLMIQSTSQEAAEELYNLWKDALTR